MTNNKIIILAGVIVIINGLIGHFFAPAGIQLTPFILITISLLIAWTNNIKVIWRSILTFSFFALNDILIKLYAGGSHDMVGLGWILLFTLIGLIPTFGILLINIIINKNDKVINKIIAIVLFIILTITHLLLFDELGLGRGYWYDWNK